MRDYFGQKEKDQVTAGDEKGQMDKRLQNLHERNSIFNNVLMCSMAD